LYEDELLVMGYIIRVAIRLAGSSAPLSPEASIDDLEYPNPHRLPAVSVTVCFVKAKDAMQAGRNARPLPKLLCSHISCASKHGNHFIVSISRPQRQSTKVLPVHLLPSTLASAPGALPNSHSVTAAAAAAAAASVVRPLRQQLSLVDPVDRDLRERFSLQWQMEHKNCHSAVTMLLHRFTGLANDGPGFRQKVGPGGSAVSKKRRKVQTSHVDAASVQHPVAHAQRQLDFPTISRDAASLELAQDAALKSSLKSIEVTAAGNTVQVPMRSRVGRAVSMTKRALESKEQSKSTKRKAKRRKRVHPAERFLDIEAQVSGSESDSDSDASDAAEIDMDSIMS
jgi:hypothetical protein